MNITHANPALRHLGLPAMAAVMALCALLPLAQPQARRADPAPSRSIEWPTTWDGAPLRPLATSDVERRFAANFPGTIARFTDGERRMIVMRHVTRPTRMLHPATDCYRGLGYRIEATRLERDDGGRLWRCFEAHPTGGGAQGGPAVAQRVCERIEDPAGSDAFTDASAWFWAASLGRSTGPWRAVTVVEAL